MLHQPPPFLESQYLDHLRLLDRFPSRKRNQYHSSSTLETPDTQPLQENYKDVTEIPSRFHGQVTYDEELQPYAFADTNARVQAEGCIYIIICRPIKRYFRYNPMINQFNLTKSKDCDWTT